MNTKTYSEHIDTKHQIRSKYVDISVVNTFVYSTSDSSKHAYVYYTHVYTHTYVLDM